jgi:hypothetical protein
VKTAVAAGWRRQVCVGQPVVFVRMAAEHAVIVLVQLLRSSGGVSSAAAQQWRQVLWAAEIQRCCQCDGRYTKCVLSWPFTGQFMLSARLMVELTVDLWPFVLRVRLIAQRCHIAAVSHLA